MVNDGKYFIDNFIFSSYPILVPYSLLAVLVGNARRIRDCCLSTGERVDFFIEDALY